MNQKLETYLDPQFVYQFTQGPDLVRSREDALRYGINCISLAHLALKDLFDHELPPNLLCLELYRDREHFEPVEQFDQMREGDLVWFGLANPVTPIEDFVPQYKDGQLLNWPDMPIKHVAVATGEADEQGEPLLLHSTFSAGTNVVWPLGKFRNVKRYQQVYGITRLRKQADIAA